MHLRQDMHEEILKRIEVQICYYPGNKTKEGCNVALARLIQQQIFLLSGGLIQTFSLVSQGNMLM